MISTSTPLSGIHAVIKASVVAPLLLAILATPRSVARADAALDAALVAAGANAGELRGALAAVAEPQQRGVRFLIEHMPTKDLRSLSADFLVEHVTHAYRAWEESPWHHQVDEELFLNSILPYASVDERRDAWRRDFYTRFKPLVAGIDSPGEAAATLNNELFPLLGVKYSRKREKANQSPYETIQSGLASCTGLSILLIDACRAVGVPARFVGTSLWSDNSGNHSWVEVWDGGWRFTGAAEPTGMALDRGWFGGRAARAQRDDPRYAIHATSFRSTPINFPMVWSRRDHTVPAVNVTDRYRQISRKTPEGHTSVRFRAVTDDGQRVACPLVVFDETGAARFSGNTRDERFDGNDHLATPLKRGERLRAVATHDGTPIEHSFEVSGDEMLVTLKLPESLDPIAQLRKELAEARGSFIDFDERTYASMPLTKEQATAACRLLWEAHKKRIKATRSDEMKAREIVEGEHTLKFAYKLFGEEPAGGRSLYISMHGGGGAPERVNTRQWKNQQQLYEPREGVYLAPRAPTDTWNMWHRPHVDSLFTRLIENLIVFENVNPDRVYLMGYSAGGDGAFQLAPRMADRWAAAAMMAGHPGDASPLNLRNLGFAIFMGGQDKAYKRNENAAKWKQELASLRSADPEGYLHQVTIYPAKGHWMDGEDASALPWMASLKRDPVPTKVVWRQDEVPRRRFYWLSVGDQMTSKGDMIVATRDGQQIGIDSEGIEQLTVLLNDDMLDLDKSARIAMGERVLFEGIAPRTIRTLSQTLADRGDPGGIFSASVTIPIGGLGNAE